LQKLAPLKCAITGAAKVCLPYCLAIMQHRKTFRVLIPVAKRNYSSFSKKISSYFNSSDDLQDKMGLCFNTLATDLMKLQEENEWLKNSRKKSLQERRKLFDQIKLLKQSQKTMIFDLQALQQKNQKLQTISEKFCNFAKDLLKSGALSYKN
jgi:SMC interacting uncharacterized protein involved in chromosome segregation